MSDMLRTFKQLNMHIDTVEMVEVSGGMRKLQAEKLGVSSIVRDGDGRVMEGVIVADDEGGDGIVVRWRDSVHDLPPAEPEIVEYAVAQEFFDALPVHQFRVEGGVWREVMVGVNWEEKEEGGGGKDDQKFVGVKPDMRIEERGMEGKGSDGEGGESPLTFCLSPTATPAVKTLLKTDHLGTAEGVEEGAVVEIGAEGYGIMEVRQAASFLIFCSIYMLPNAALYDKLTPILVTPLLTLLASLIAAINQ